MTNLRLRAHGSVLAGALLAAACGNAGDSRDSCMPGGGCTCPGGEPGTLVCDGSAFGTCDCGPIGTGGGGAGGRPGTGGTGGLGTTDNATKVDLLLVVDNSAQMADKQEVLAATIPHLVNGLVGSGSSPLTDLHVGVITSSLGGLGADVCGRDEQDDGGRLVVRDGTGLTVPTYQGLGFAAWDPNQALNPPGESDASALSTTVQTLVRGAGQSGCGFEAPLEAMYRFLVDPDPYERIARVPCFPGDTDNGCADGVGTDLTLLQQRAAFLRPDSLLLIVLLTDENDCSVRAQGQNYIVGQLNQPSGLLFHLPRSTDPCRTDPDDPCCYSCRADAPTGCPEPSEYSSCQINNGFYDFDGNEDQINLRCWDQKRRFGLDFLYPVSRYVRGLRDPQIEDRRGVVTNNPIYSDLKNTGAPIRRSNLVYFAAISGVPSELVDDETASTPDTLVYETPEELHAEGAWNAIVGPCLTLELDGECDSTRVPAIDPLMRESVDARAGGGPSGAPMAPANSGPLANPINGHEYNIPLRDNLQYACVFPLPAPRPPLQTFVCSQPDPAVSLNPLCQDPRTGGYDGTQHFAGAFPSIRQLEVAKGLRDQGLVASICARNTTDPTRPDFGYRPAVDAILRAVGPALQ